MSRFQFSIRFLLLATTVVAAAVAGANSEPSLVPFLAISCLSFAFATVAVVGVTQTTGKQRAFWIGTTIVLASAVFIAGNGLIFASPYILHHEDSANQVFESYMCVWPIWCVAPANGIFAVFVHWLFQPKQTAAEREKNQISK